MRNLFFTLLTLLVSASAWGYANFIGHSYTSCLNCHYNPFGGGPLNDYGRVVSATAISGRSFYPEKWTDEKLAYASGFLFRKPKQEWLRTQVNYRGFRLVNQPGSGSKEEARWVNMQADARMVIKFGENDRFVAVGNYGYAPVPRGTADEEDIPKYRSREAYMGFRFTPKFGLYAGLMDKVYGLRVIEHIAYSRISPQVTMNDQVHGVTAHYVGEKFEMGLQGFMGNMEQDDDLRMKGGSTMWEFTAYEHHRLGFSYQRAGNEYLYLSSAAVHGRFNLKEGSALLGEIGQTEKTPKAPGSTGVTDRYALLQTYLRPTRGLYFLSNVEYYNRDVKQDDYTVRWGPGIQYFPLQRMELRFDIYNIRNFAKESSSKDTWMYVLQTHLWL